MAEGALSGDEHDAMDDSGESGEEDHDDDEMSEDYSSSEPSGGSEDDPLDHHGLPEVSHAHGPKVCRDPLPSLAGGPNAMDRP